MAAVKTAAKTTAKQKRRKVPVKRTQAQRHAQTRRAIIDATVACIDAYGFPKTTMQKVAHEAGCTVGAVQHHFASKSDLLAAVLEDGFRSLSFELEHVLFEEKSLSERVALFIDHCWLHFRQPAFQANLHILLGMRNESPKALDEWMQGPLAAISLLGSEQWMSVFPDIDLSEKQHNELLYYVFSSMSGIVTFSRIIETQSQAALIESNIGVLKDLLLARFPPLVKKSRSQRK
jgi:AcrR family transcriptional regulator